MLSVVLWRVRNGSGGERRHHDWLTSNRKEPMLHEALPAARRPASVGRLGRQEGAARGGTCSASSRELGNWKGGKVSDKWRVMKRCVMKGKSRLN